ncbi:MAG: Isocitrate dehydrogenase [NADP] [Sodalis sp.]|nr:MAG: Isocitrate dehydrogenase [NADP] [Sodalis sp.]
MLHAEQLSLAMANPDKGITNLHVPGNIIVDASMPAMIRDSGKMCGPDGKLIPRLSFPTAVMLACTRRYLRLQAAWRFCSQDHGQRAQRGVDGAKGRRVRSHDKTFQIPANGVVQIADEAGNFC